SFERQLGDRVTKRLKSPASGLFRHEVREGVGAVANRIDTLKRLLDERIVLLDGAWGVLLQQRLRSEEEYRGEWFRDHSSDVGGDPDLLNLTQPDVVLELHREYFAAGADIATTNTFTATSIGQ